MKDDPKTPSRTTLVRFGIMYTPSRCKAVQSDLQVALEKPGLLAGLPMPSAADVEEMRACLATINQQVRFIAPIDPVSAANVLRAARKSDPHATPDEVAWLLRHELVHGAGSPERFSSWGVVVKAVFEDFLKWGEHTPHTSQEHRRQMPQNAPTAMAAPIESKQPGAVDIAPPESPDRPCERCNGSGYMRYRGKTRYCGCDAGMRVAQRD